MNKKKTLFILLGLLALTAAVVFGYKFVQKESLLGPKAPESIAIETVQDPQVELPETTSSFPTTLNITVPFYTQAPFSNWDYPWQEACEEASVALVANLYLEKNWTKEQFNEELLALVDWENEHFGTYRDTTAAETAEFMEANYGLKSILHEDPSFEDIQSILNEGHLIIAPFAGKLLGNPNFKNGGPLYHMLVIKGYDAEKEQIVTNDVGTRNGADYVYNWSVLQNAMHDWNDEDILLGAKRILEVLPPNP